MSKLKINENNESWSIEYPNGKYEIGLESVTDDPSGDYTLVQVKGVLVETHEDGTVTVKAPLFPTERLSLIRWIQLIFTKE